jgi:hypothetical protein
MTRLHLSNMEPRSIHTISYLDYHADEFFHHALDKAVCIGLKRMSMDWTKPIEPMQRISSLYHLELGVCQYCSCSPGQLCIRKSNLGSPHFFSPIPIYHQSVNIYFVNFKPICPKEDVHYM